METKQKTQMTPGPWQVGGLLVSGKGGVEIAMVREKKYDGPFAPPLEVADYNAVAIAALPELLAAAKAWLDKWSDNDYTTAEEYAAVKAMYAAVAKAGG